LHGGLCAADFRLIDIVQAETVKSRRKDRRASEQRGEETQKSGNENLALLLAGRLEDPYNTDDDRQNQYQDRNRHKQSAEPRYQMDKIPPGVCGYDIEDIEKNADACAKKDNAGVPLDAVDKFLRGDVHFSQLRSVCNVNKKKIQQQGSKKNGSIINQIDTLLSLKRWRSFLIKIIIVIFLDKNNSNKSCNFNKMCSLPSMNYLID